MGARAAAGTVDRDRSGGAAPRPLMSPPRRCSSLAALRTQGPSCERARVAEELTVAFDELDKRIVAALVDDGRATYAEVGARVGLSAPAVKRRVDGLRASGAITGFSARVDPLALGWTTEAYVELFCRGRTSPAEIAAAVGKHPEVTDACTVTGEADALLHIRAADMRHFQQVVERISPAPLVVPTPTFIVLSHPAHPPDTPPPPP